MPVKVTIQSNRAQLRAHAIRAFWLSVDDMQRQASKNAPRRTGRLAGSGRIEKLGETAARVIFDRIYATAQEKGAWIAPKHGQKVLHIPVAGGFRSVKGVRLPARHYLKAAGDAWGKTFIQNRLRLP